MVLDSLDALDIVFTIDQSPNLPAGYKMKDQLIRFGHQ